MATESRTGEPAYEAHKRALLGALHGDVLEIGPGTGPNLAYYPADIRWTGIEPNPAMFPYLEEEARRLHMDVTLREGRSERLDVPDNSFDAVVSTRVLCSVTDPHTSLREVLRVLKVGGRFIFIEHVAAPPATRLRWFQRAVQPIWTPIGDGCRPDRETWVTIENAGFSRVHVEHFRVSTPIVSPHIAGYAIK